MRKPHPAFLVLLALCALGLGSLAPSGGTAARFTDSATLTSAAIATDTFTLTRSDVTVHPKPQQRIPVWSTPGERITNNAHSGDMRITLQQFMLTRADAQLRAEQLAEKLQLTYTIARGDQLTTCLEASDRETVSSTHASIKLGQSTKVAQNADIVLAPGESILLCPQLDLDYASVTNADINNIYRDLAGQAVTLTTTYTNVFPTASGAAPQGSQWGGEQRAVNTYVLNAPVMTIGKQAMSECGGTPFMRPNYVEVPFSWPDADGLDKVAPEAISYWEVYFRKSGTSEAWQRIGDDGDGNALLDTLSGSTSRIDPTYRRAKIHARVFANYGWPDGGGFYALDLRFRGRLNLTSGSEQPYWVGSDHAVRVRVKDRALGSLVGECSLISQPSAEISLPSYFQVRHD